MSEVLDLKRTYSIAILLLSFVLISPAWAGIRGMKICGLASHAKVEIMLSDGTKIRTVRADKSGIAFTGELHGEHWIVESTGANGKRFFFEHTQLSGHGTGTLLVNCIKLL